MAASRTPVDLELAKLQLRLRDVAARAEGAATDEQLSELQDELFALIAAINSRINDLEKRPPVVINGGGGVGGPGPQGAVGPRGPVANSWLPGGW